VVLVAVLLIAVGVGAGKCPYTNPKFPYRGIRIVERDVPLARWEYKTGCWGNCTGESWVELNETGRWGDYTGPDLSLFVAFEDRVVEQAGGIADSIVKGDIGRGLVLFFRMIY